MTYEGHCLCGALHYASPVAPIDAGYCHCGMCQRLSGSAVLPWASFDTAHFAYTKGAPKIYKSSPHGQREFCGTCGSQIAFRSTARHGTVEVNIGTLAEPDKVPPEVHIYCNSKLAWFEVDDALPRYPEAVTAEDAG